MKCKAKDCKGCVHLVDIQKHPVFGPMQIQTEDGKPLLFEGCMFHLHTIFTMLAWRRQIGVQVAVESSRNETVKVFRTLSNNVAAMGFMALEVPGNEPKRIGE